MNDGYMSISYVYAETHLSCSGGKSLLRIYHSEVFLPLALS